MRREHNVAKQLKIGQRLSRAMVKAHMNRDELAELTGYSAAQIMNWESGRSVLYPIELIKLCHALDVMPEWLLCWEKRRLH
jgi:transcriptional regulator with XRE-family HTH domain